MTTSAVASVTRPAAPRVPIALYPAAIAVALVTELVNVGGVSPFAAIRSWLIVAVGALLLSALGRLVLRDKHRGGILAMLWVLSLLGGDDPRFIIVLAAATVVMLLERYALSPGRRTIRWAYIGRWGGRLAGVIALAILIQSIQMGVLQDAWRTVTHETPLRPGLGPVVDGTDPDIYLVLLDGYTRSDVFEQVVGGSNAGFISALESDGFSVATRGRSNYTNTSETLSSMFSAAHLDEIDAMKPLLDGTEVRSPGAVVRRTINDNRTVDLLHARGYEISTIASGWEQVTMREADVYVDTGQINEFEIGVLRRSLVGHTLESIAPDAVSQQQRDRINGVFDALETAPSRPGERPRFIFAHVPSPHPPWVYHADGSPRTVVDLDGIYGETPATVGLDDEALAAGYIGQVVDVNRRMLAALERLDVAIAARGRPAVTIIFSDHGTWIGADRGDIRLRFKILLAVRSTDEPISIRDNETLVNLLPTVFAAIYDEHWERRPDTQYRIGPRDNFDLISVDDPDADGP